MEKVRVVGVAQVVEKAVVQVVERLVVGGRVVEWVEVVEKVGVVVAL